MWALFHILNQVRAGLDTGGIVESRVIEAAENADITVVPLSHQSTADLIPTVINIQFLLRRGVSSGSFVPF